MYIASYPGMNTVLAQLMKHEGYELLYAPPYESWMQPIELMRARVKHEVATQSRRGRTHQQTADQTRTALTNITARTCQNIICHTHKLMDEWLRSSAAGSLQSFGNLAALQRATEEQLKMCDDLAADDGVVMPDAAASGNRAGGGSWTRVTVGKRKKRAGRRWRAVLIGLLRARKLF